MLKIAIIGTAGRGTDSMRLLPSSFAQMVSIADDIIQSITKEPVLVSGGAAWADHVAVKLWADKKTERLELHLPSHFDTIIGKYIDNGKINSTSNPGGISNYYHKNFSKICNIDSLQELSEAILYNPITVGKGFHERNNRVARADAVIAFTFGEGSKLKDGGTADTFGKYLKRCAKNVSFHVDLHTWKVYTPGTL